MLISHVTGFPDVPVSMHAGTLKLLDVNMFGWPAHTGRPAVGTSAECCYACADTPGCNVWNFCPLPQGCGAGCTAAKFGPNPGATYVSHPPYCNMECVHVLADCTLSLTPRG